MRKEDQRCINCQYCVPSIIEGKVSEIRKSCDVPFDLSTAPAVIYRHHIIEPGVIAPECPHWKAK